MLRTKLALTLFIRILNTFKAFYLYFCHFSKRWGTAAPILDDQNDGSTIYRTMDDDSEAQRRRYDAYDEKQAWTDSWSNLQNPIRKHYVWRSWQQIRAQRTQRSFGRPNSAERRRLDCELRGSALGWASVDLGAGAIRSKWIRAPGSQSGRIGTAERRGDLRLGRRGLLACVRAGTGAVAAGRSAARLGRPNPPREGPKPPRIGPKPRKPWFLTSIWLSMACHGTRTLWRKKKKKEVEKESGWGEFKKLKNLFWDL